MFIVLRSKPVFFKHKANDFYDSLAYVVSMALAQVSNNELCMRDLKPC